MADDFDTTLPVRLTTHIKRVGDCWQWTGRTAGKGYGRAWDGKRDGWVHRIVYEMLVGPIPRGMQIDHLCRNKLCCNPAHLEVVTSRENTLRSTSPEVTRARHKSQTHCKRGHPLFGDNLRMYRGLRNCRACALEHSNAYKERNREAVRERDRKAKRAAYAKKKAPDILAEIDRLNSHPFRRLAGRG